MQLFFIGDDVASVVWDLFYESILKFQFFIVYKLNLCWETSYLERHWQHFFLVPKTDLTVNLITSRYVILNCLQCYFLNLCN